MNKQITGSFFSNVEFNAARPAISVILETSNSKEIRILLASGQIMKAHKAPYPITVQVLDGEIEFGVMGETLILKQGDIIALESNVVHDLKGAVDSNIRLTLNKLDSAERVEKVID